MHEIQCSFVLYLLVLVTFESSNSSANKGTGIITKYVCTGESLQLFEKIVLDSQDTVVSLYMNHQTRILMAQWEVHNSTIKPNIKRGYEEKVYLNKDGSVWIQNVNHWDEESYSIEYDNDASYVKYEVEIHVKVAPKKNCKPKITHEENILIASLVVEDCGIPVASVQWLDYPGLSNTSEPVINLPPGNEAGTYYACIKGPALECAKISALSDYCSSYTIGQWISHDTTTTWSPENETQGGSVMIGTLVMIVIVFALMTAMSMVILYSKRARRHSKKENENEAQKMHFMDLPLLLTTKFENENEAQKMHFMDLPLLPTEKFENENEDQEMLVNDISWLPTEKFGKLQWENIMQLLNGDQQQGLRKHCEVLNGEYPQLWQSHFGNLKWENIIHLLNGDQQQGLRKHCERLIEEFPQLWQNHFGKLQWENIMQLLNGDQQQGLRKHCEVLNGEYPQLWQSHFGKLKWEDIMQLLNGYQKQGFQKHCDAEAEKIIDRESCKRRQTLKMMKRTGELPEDVYQFLCDKLFDPNVLE